MHEPQRGRRSPPPLALAAPRASSRPFPRPDPSPQSPSSGTSLYPVIAAARRLAHLLGLALERELPRVDADDDKSPLAVVLVPGADVGERPQPVDAGARPEVDEHDPACQVLRGQRRRVEPPGRVLEPG